VARSPHAPSLFVGLSLACLAAAGCARADHALPLGGRAQDCALCHAEQADAFATSAHARSDRSPVVAALRERVRDAWGAQAAASCERCHAPGHAPAPLPGEGAEAERSVTCVSCHAAVGNRGERDGLLLVDTSAPLGGPFDDAEPSVAHASRRAELVSSPSLCGTCHEVTGPRLFVEETLTEHRAAAPAPGDPSCATCHMPRLDEGPVAAGATRARARRDHGFVGLDPPWGADPETARRASDASARLVADALALDVAAHDGLVVVRVTNVGARHAVPTGVAFLRDVWVDVELEDGQGGLRIMERVIELGDRPMHAGTLVSLPTEADRIERRRLDYLESREAPVEAGPDVVRVRAVLRARAFREDALEALGLSSRAAEVPVLEAELAEVALR
jgi:hypothetical protein